MNTNIRPLKGARLRCGCLVRCVVTLNKNGLVDPNHPRAIQVNIDFCKTHKHAGELLAFVERVTPTLPEEEGHRARLLVWEIKCAG